MMNAEILRDPQTMEQLLLEPAGAVNAVSRKIYPKDGGYYSFLEEAEALPFRDNAFDCVYHVGGINYFSDPHRAVLEMIRVAKPGTKLMIADETEKLVKGTYEKVPVVKGYFGEQKELPKIMNYIPDTMTELAYKEVCKGLMYCITFRKPK